LKDFGGVRIEDVILITKDGFENFTQTPRTIDEVRMAVGMKQRRSLFIRTGRLTTNAGFGYFSPLFGFVV
jgi:hypothetical protein